MAQPAQFVADLVAAAKLLTYAMDQLSGLKERFDADSKLAVDYPTIPGARTDITTQDIQNVLLGAFAQMELAYRSGAPTQKSLFDKLL